MNPLAGNILAESPEALEAQRAQEEQNAALDKKYSDPKILKDQMDTVNKSLYGGAFVAPEEHDDRIYDPDSPEGEILNRIAARVDTQFGGNPEILNPELFQESAKERNAQRAEQLFFSPEIIQEQIKSVGEGSPEENKQINQEWLDANLGENGVLNEAFERIQENFVLPHEITGESVGKIYQSDPNDPKTINVANAEITNAALADAFLLEIEGHTLKGKINYPEEQVRALMQDIASMETMPFEKLQKFGEIHTLVNTSIAKGAKKQSEAFRNRQKQSANTAEQQQAFFAQKEEVTGEAPRQNSFEEDTPQKNNSVGSGDIFHGGELDISSESRQQKETN